jgi:hypothetical protein
MNQISPVVYGFCGIFCVMLVGAVIAVISSRKVKWPAAPEVASAAKPEQKLPGYTYKDFARDLSDENVDIAAIMERCKGALPPEQGQVGTDGIPSQENANALQGPPGPDAPPPLGLDGRPAARVSEKLPAAADRQAWFAQLAQQLPKLKIVTPPAPQVVIAVKGMAIPCSCRSGIYTSPSQDRYSSPQRGPFHPEVAYDRNGPGSVKSPKCEKCNGTGTVISLGGK